ncbi:hypothetical protein RUM43_002127 [Polyplax serrata]|uniref:Uncharacterized protein n=1 Tax=Polyplax serrata TaxID=468196 RepID=A0AAN8P1W5_POLSC
MAFQSGRMIHPQNIGSPTLNGPSHKTNKQPSNQPTNQPTNQPGLDDTTFCQFLLIDQEPVLKSLIVVRYLCPVELHLRFSVAVIKLKRPHRNLTECQGRKEDIAHVKKT